MNKVLLLILLLLPSQVFAKRVGPGVRVEADNLNKKSARVILTNAGDKRGVFINTVVDPLTGENIPAKVFPARVVLAPGRDRKIRFTNLPNKTVYLCSTVDVTPALALRSCLLRER